MEPATASVDLPVPPDHAFGVVTAGLGTWWPAEYSWGPDVLDTHELEPRAGGRVAEVSVHGNRYDWGRITTWDPPNRLVMEWQIGPDRVPTPDPAACSTVEVIVEADGDGSIVTVTHRGFEVYGDAGQAYRDALAGDGGWAHILDGLASTLGDA